MKMTTIRALLLMTISLTTGASKADPHPVGDVQTKTAELAFSQASKISFNIIPINNLSAGLNKNNTQVATYILSTNQPSYLALRWTPNSGIINGTSIKITGKGDPAHTLSLKFVNNVNSITTRDGSWVFTGTKIASLNGKVVVAGDQTVPADTYTISMDASVFAA